MSAPILVIGAHRSGTSALNRVLGALGVFTGARRDRNDEAWFFLRLNVWLLRHAGVRWDHPRAFADLVADADVRAFAVDYLRRSVASPRCANYLGLRRWLRGGLPALAEPWGFKDPRTTFTLPLWLDVFPDARVLHIRRHGVDVAASLRHRERKNLARSRGLRRNRPPLFGLLPKFTGFTDSVRCLSLAGAFEVWAEYVDEGNRQAQRLGSRALTLDYEELTRRPHAVIDEVAAFCGLLPTAAQREHAATLLRDDRASAFHDDPELAAFAAEVAEREAALRAGRRPAPALVTT